MTTPPSPQPATCHECGAQLKSGADRCWLCHALVPVEAEISQAPAVPPVAMKWQRPAGKSPPWQFSIETLLLVTTLVAVCLGASLALPGLGIPACFVAVPALIRTLVASRQQRVAGHKLTLVEKVLAFLASAGIMIAVFAAGGAAFFATCTVSLLAAAGIDQAAGPGTPAMEVVILPALLLSVLAALVAGSWIFWLTRPKAPRW